MAGYNFKKYDGNIAFFDDYDVYYYNMIYARSSFSGNKFIQTVFRIPFEQAYERPVCNLEYIPDTPIAIDGYAEEGNYVYLKTAPYLEKED